MKIKNGPVVICAVVAAAISIGGSTLWSSTAQADDNKPDFYSKKLAEKAKSELYYTKTCSGCHSMDGSKKVGPTWKGIWGTTETVVTDGETREVTVDYAYIRRSIEKPHADVVEGYPKAMPELGLTDEEIRAIASLIYNLK